MCIRDRDCLWQRPNESTKSTKRYCNVPVGQNILGGMMPRLSEKYKLSQRYTNHSIRVTSLQVLEDANVEGRHIIRVSGHKSLESVQNYARKLSSERKRSISTIFSNSVENKKMNLEEQNNKPQPISNDTFNINK